MRFGGNAKEGGMVKAYNRLLKTDPDTIIGSFDEDNKAEVALAEKVAAWAKQGFAAQVADRIAQIEKDLLGGANDIGRVIAASTVWAYLHLRYNLPKKAKDLADFIKKTKFKERAGEIASKAFAQARAFIQDAIRRIEANPFAGVQIPLFDKGSVRQYLKLLDKGLSAAQAIAEYAKQTGKTPTKAQVDAMERVMTPLMIKGIKAKFSQGIANGLNYKDAIDATRKAFPNISDKQFRGFKTAFENIAKGFIKPALKESAGVKAGFIENFRAYAEAKLTVS